MTRPSARSLPRLAGHLAIALFAGAGAASCVLKKPPEVAELKTTAMPAVTLPPQWTATGAAAGAVTNNWLAGFRDEQLTALVLEAVAHNPNL